MSYQLRVGHLILTDMEKARAWYERQADGLGSRLESEFFAALDEIAQHPLACPSNPASPQRGVRHRLLVSFPYAIYFHVAKDEIHVVLFFHGARNPALLRRELKRRLS